MIIHPAIAAWNTYNVWAEDETWGVFGCLNSVLPTLKRKTRALDLGAGDLKASRFLAKHGFEHIDAVDISTYSTAAKRPENVAVHHCRIEDFVFAPRTYDLIHAKESLPYVDSGELERVFQSCFHSLASGGTFCGTFFGTYHQPVSSLPKCVCLESDALRNLLEPLQVQRLRVKSYPNLPGFDGVKRHAQLITFIAVKTA